MYLKDLVTVILQTFSGLAAGSPTPSFWWWRKLERGHMYHMAVERPQG